MTIVDFRNKTFEQIEEQDNPCYDFKKYDDVWERNNPCILITKANYRLFGEEINKYDEGYLVTYCPMIKTDIEPQICKGYKIIDEQNVFIIGIFKTIEVAVDIAEFYSEEIWRLG